MILGIDPGLSGAFALLDDGALSLVDDLPTMGTKTARQINGAQLAATLSPLPINVAVVELVGAMPGQGVSSMFRFGHAVGQVLGILQALKIPLVRVTPGVWKRSFGLGAEKDASRARAINLFPQHHASFARVKDDGRAEAALIALWGFKNDTTATAVRGAGAGEASAAPVSITD